MVKQKIEILSLPEIFTGVSKDFVSRDSKPDLPSGLIDLDRIIWGLHRKELLTIGARPSVGKSALAVQLALNLNNEHHNVLFISLEMSKEQIVERMFCNLTGTNNMDLREGKIEDELKDRIPFFSKMANDMPMLVVDNCGYNFADVEKLIVEMEPRPDVVFIDYIQMISQGRHTNKSMAVEEYFRKLKELSTTYNFAMVVLSQIKRMEEKRQNRRPTMDELKWSGALEEHSDLVILLYWPAHDIPNYADGREYELNIAKQRHGRTGIVKVNFFPWHYRFENRKEQQNDRSSSQRADLV